ncbi:MAG: hypothetical protein FJ279_01680 [Planctomycetes bacterium]|nr:hypothetical protein [Planctomycetota bacterium]
MQSHHYAVIYNSGLVISDPGELATFCAFYDTTWLPYTDAGSCRKFVHVVEGKIVAMVHRIKYITEDGRKAIGGDEIIQWEKQHEDLFLERVIAKTPPPAKRTSEDELEERWFPAGGRDVPKEFEKVNFRLLIPLVDRDGRPKDAFALHEDLARHLLRRDLPLPQVFITHSKSASREVLKAIQARAIFTYFLPSLSQLRDDQILEVRRKVRDLREGFSMHLQTLSKGVEERISGGEGPEELTAYARSVVETDLIPDYREFRRQLAAEKGGFWSQVLDRAGKVFEIDTAPWTPKFYGDVLKALGFTALAYASARKESLSNRSQALQFMARVEDVFKGEG